MIRKYISPRAVLLLAILPVFLLAGCQFPWDYPGISENFVLPATSVKSFGYYGTDGLIDDVKDHSNTIMTAAGSWDKLQSIQADHLTAVVDITSLFLDSNLNLNSDYQSQWASFATQLAPYVNNMQAFYLLDEPYANAQNLHIPKAVIKSRLEQIIPIIKASFPNIPVATVFCDSSLLWNFSIPKGYDWVGMDCYGGFDSCDSLPVPIYLDILQNNMNAHQKMILVPGTMVFQKAANPSYAEESEPTGWFKQYYEYALRNQNVAAIWGFIWPTIPGVTGTDTGESDLPYMKSIVSDLMHLIQFQGRPEFDATLYRFETSFKGTDSDTYGNWITNGVNSGVRSGLMFDVLFYQQTSPQLLAANPQPSYQDALNYWILHGENQGSATSAEFDADFYMQVNPDLISAFGADNYKAGLNHWYNTGVHEGRRTSPAFDITYYAENNNFPHLLTSTGVDYEAAWRYWLEKGIDSGGRPSLEFDPNYYLNNNPDLASLRGPNQYRNAINHWVSTGLAEGRQASADFDVKYYLSTAPGLAAAVGATNYRAALINWLTYGKKAGLPGVANGSTATPIAPSLRPTAGPILPVTTSTESPPVPEGSAPPMTPPRPTAGPILPVTTSTEPQPPPVISTAPIVSPPTSGPVAPPLTIPRPSSPVLSSGTGAGGRIKNE